MSPAGAATSAPRLVMEPFRIHGTDIPPNLLLIAKILLIGLVLKGYPADLPDVFAPIVPIFEGIPAPYWRLGLTLVLFIAGVSLMFNRAVRVSCLAIGAVFILATMSARTAFHNGTFFLGLVFTMIGLQERNKPPTLLAFQLGVMYFSAGLNKLFESDWRSGQYFAHFLGTVKQSPVYAAGEILLPHGLLPLMLCWQIITMELSAGILFFIPRYRKMAVWLATGVHAGAAVMVYADYGMYLAAVLSSYLLILEWPNRLMVAGPREGAGALLVWLHRLSHRDEPSVTYVTPPSGTLEIRADGRVHTGFAAFWRLALWTPALYALAMVTMTAPRGFALKLVVLGVGITAMLAMAFAAAFWLQRRLRPTSIPAESV
jgi:hypothetical protein